MRTTKIILAVASVTESVVHGFAQMGSLGQSDLRELAARKTAAEALRGDWGRAIGAIRNYDQKSLRQDRSRTS